VDYFSRLAAIPDVSAFLRYGGTNFAIGGSTSLYLASQIGAFLGRYGSRANPSNPYWLKDQIAATKDTFGIAQYRHQMSLHGPVARYLQNHTLVSGDKSNGTNSPSWLKGSNKS
jgi:hypothetical protein